MKSFLILPKNYQQIVILSSYISHTLKFCHKEVGRKTAVGLACFRRGGRGKEKTGGWRALEFKEYKSL
jgi:hypothetical protein